MERAKEIGDSSAMEIHEALQDIEIAFRQLEFTIKLLSFCELRKIDPSEFDTDHVVMLEEGNLNFPTGYFSDANNITRAAAVSALLAFGATVLVLDKAFEVMGMKCDPEATDNVGQLQILVYMVRCAYAHGIAEPRWEVRGKYLRSIFVDLDGTSIAIDLHTLNGQVFMVEHLGGYANWYRVRDAVVQALS